MWSMLTVSDLNDLQAETDADFQISQSHKTYYNDRSWTNSRVHIRKWWCWFRWRHWRWEFFGRRVSPSAASSSQHETLPLLRDRSSRSLGDHRRRSTIVWQQMLTAAVDVCCWCCCCCQHKMFWNALSLGPAAAEAGNHQCLRSFALEAQHKVLKVVADT